LRLEGNQAGSDFERPLGLWVVFEVLVEVGSGQGHDDRKLGKRLMETVHRWKTAASVHRHQQVAFLGVTRTKPVMRHFNLMPQFAQETGPTLRGGAIAGVEFGPRRVDQQDVHF